MEGSIQLLVISWLAVIPTHAQIDIQKTKSEYITQKHVAAEDLSKEIYTSMHELNGFFVKEKEYIHDLQQVMDKKLVGVEAQGAIGAYIASYEDAIGEQEDDETFLYNPLNVYNLIR